MDHGDANIDLFMALLTGLDAFVAYDKPVDFIGGLTL